MALERLQQVDAERLRYDSITPGPDGSGPQILTPLELIARLAALCRRRASIVTATSACWRPTHPCALR